MATEINAYDQTLCTVAATLTAASLGIGGDKTRTDRSPGTGRYWLSWRTAGEFKEVWRRIQRGAGSCLHLAM